MGKNNPEQVKENTFVMKIWLKLSFFAYLVYTVIQSNLYAQLQIFQAKSTPSTL